MGHRRKERGFANAGYSLAGKGEDGMNSRRARRCFGGLTSWGFGVGIDEELMYWVY